MEYGAACLITTVGEVHQTSGREIAEALTALRKDSSGAERRSWSASIPVLAGVLHRAGLDELTLLLEYETPAGGRIDALLLGERRDTGRPLVLVIELKQWSSIGENTAGWASRVLVPISAGGCYEDRLHPVQQTLTYAKHLRENHSSIEGGRMEVQCRQFLHNFEHKEQLFQGKYEAYRSLQNETYGKGEEERLAEDLKALFSARPRPDVAERFLTGTYVLGQIGMDALRRALSRQENAVMLDDQVEVNRMICDELNGLRNEAYPPKLVVISGPPGTGKTVVGMHILYAYCLQYGATGRNNGGGIFALPRSRTLSQVIEGGSGVAPVYLEQVPRGRDLVVADEAHRIENLDAAMTSLFERARMVVVLQDDRQRIRLTEEGTQERFEGFAREHGIELLSCSLATQKRAGYLGSYVSDLDELLYEGRNEPIRRSSRLELRCWDALLDLDRHLGELQRQGRHVKWYAPYCWHWSGSVLNRDIVIRTREGVFQKAWNPKNGQYAWYRGEQKQDLDQVGCIYTAQGLEFDDTGVIWWKDLRWDGESQTWRTDLDESWDRQFVSSIVEYFGGRLEGGRPPWRVRYEDRQMSMAEFLRDSQADQDAILELMLNTYRVLLTRAKSSVHIWFADPATREHVRTVMRI